MRARVRCSVAAAALLLLAACGTGASAAGRTGAGDSATAGTTAAQSSPATAVGVLLVRATDGSMTQRCTAAVVDTASEDVVLTAAHCVSSTQQLLFAPGYHDGIAPLGTWTVLGSHTDPAWQDHADPDADYAFLRVEPSSTAHGSEPVQRAAGGLRLGTAPLLGDRVTVIGYPTALDGKRLTCTADVRTTREFPTVDCVGFSNGTSGGPLLRQDGQAGAGTVVGVIGGLEAGGCTADISYASPFTTATRAVLAAAVRGDPSSPAPRSGPTGTC